MDKPFGPELSSGPDQDVIQKNDQETPGQTDESAGLFQADADGDRKDSKDYARKGNRELFLVVDPKYPCLRRIPCRSGLPEFSGSHLSRLLFLHEAEVPCCLDIGAQGDGVVLKLDQTVPFLFGVVLVYRSSGQVKGVGQGQGVGPDGSAEGGDRLREITPVIGNNHLLQGVSHWVDALGIDHQVREAVIERVGLDP